MSQYSSWMLSGALWAIAKGDVPVPSRGELLDPLRLDPGCQQRRRQLVERLPARSGEREVIEPDPELAEAVVRHRLAGAEEEDPGRTRHDVEPATGNVRHVVDREAQHLPVEGAGSGGIADGHHDVVQAGCVHQSPRPRLAMAPAGRRRPPRHGIVRGTGSRVSSCRLTGGQISIIVAKADRTGPLRYPQIGRRTRHARHRGRGEGVHP